MSNEEQSQPNSEPLDASNRKQAVKNYRQTVLSNVDDAAKGEKQLATVRRRFRSKKKHFCCPLLLKNRLPDPVPGPKLMAIPIELRKFVDFKPTSLDLEYKWKHHCERTLGVHVELVDLEAQTPATNGKRAQLHPDDERLLKWDSLGQPLSGSGAAPRKDRAFFRKTVFMSNDLSRNSALIRGGKDDRIKNSPMLELNADSIISNANESFSSFGETSSVENGSAVKRNKHKPHLAIEWSLPIFPDTELWSNHYRYVGFDDDPGSSSSSKRRRAIEGMIVNSKTEYNIRSQSDIMTGSFIIPSSTSNSNVRQYDWQRQYAMRLEKTKDENVRGSHLFLVDQEKCCVTFKQMAPQKLELRGGISATQERSEEKDSFSVCRREFTESETKSRKTLLDVLFVDQGNESEAGSEEDEGEEDVISHQQEEVDGSESGLSDA